MEMTDVVNIFGDGAINRGPFLEGLNWARIYDLPVLFVCEDNGFAATTRSADLTAGDTRASAVARHSGYNRGRQRPARYSRSGAQLYCSHS